MKRLRTQVLAALIVVGLGVIVALAVLNSQRDTTPQALPLVNTFDRSPTGFSFQYPADWDYIIPAQGVLLAGFPETLHENVPGPVFSVQRGLPVSILDDLSGAIRAYLQSGPLRVSGRWQITAAETETTLEDRAARVVELEGSEIAEGLPLHTRIIATTADNSFVYLFVITVPVRDLTRFEPTFDAMLASVRILE